MKVKHCSNKRQYDDFPCRLALVHTGSEEALPMQRITFILYAKRASLKMNEYKLT